MGSPVPHSDNTALKGLRRPLFLTRAGLVAERLTRAFWPLWTILMLAMAALMLGAQDVVNVETAWAAILFAVFGVVGALIYGFRRFRWPDHAETRARLDETLPARPIAALTDTQAIGATDPASRAVWNAHRDRMAALARSARAPAPDLRVSRRDPFALRYVALLAFCTAVLFGSFWRVGTVAELAPGTGGANVAAGPSWEGWVEPPAYTGLPSLYLNDLRESTLSIPEGSLISLRLYGEVGRLSVTQDIAVVEEEADTTNPAQSFTISQSGALSVDGPNGASWQITMLEDSPPTVHFDGELEVEASGVMQQEFVAQDDFGVVAGRADITLDLAALDHRYGLQATPDEVEPITLDLPITISGDRADFVETLVENFSEHVWSGLPVEIILTVEDALGQSGQSEVLAIPLPGRRFFDPLARAVIEARRDILWARSNGARVAQVLRAVSHRPDDIFRDSSAYLMLRVALRRLEAANDIGMSDDAQAEIAAALWDIALQLEDGSLSDALERLRRAQDRLTQAMRDGASDDEIAQLMQEMRDAMEDYMRQLAQNPEAAPQGPQNENAQQLSQQDLDDMMDRIQELMEEGRMAEAQELLDQLSQMMENMRVTEGDPNSGQSPGEQAMEGLSDTLRDQQGLSDEAFRDLQEQFNPGAQAGESSENEGRNGGQGRGQSHEGQGGQGEGQDRDGEGGSNGGAGRPGGQDGGQGDLADRQQALRDELSRQQEGLPGEGTPEGDAAREALDRAGRAMDGAEDALRDDNFAEALDNQAEAMEALREGLRQLGEALAQQNEQNAGQQGDAESQARRQTRDPLGRNPGNQGLAGTDEGLLQGEDIYRRARELLDELRERSSDQTRPTKELNYLKRLLDRF